LKKPNELFLFPWQLHLSTIKCYCTLSIRSAITPCCHNFLFLFASIAFFVSQVPLILHLLLAFYFFFKFFSQSFSCLDSISISHTPTSYHRSSYQNLLRNHKSRPKYCSLFHKITSKPDPKKKKTEKKNLLSQDFHFYSFGK